MGTTPNGGADERPLLNNSQYDPHSLPNFDTEFISSEELQAFSEALNAPTTTPVTALNDWRPIHQKIKKAKRRREARRTKDETREGFVYSILYWPLLFGVLGWIVFLVSDIFHQHWHASPERERRQLWLPVHQCVLMAD